MRLRSDSGFMARQANWNHSHARWTNRDTALRTKPTIVRTLVQPAILPERSPATSTELGHAACFRFLRQPSRPNAPRPVTWWRMSALPQKADMCSATRDVRFRPTADIVEMSALCCPRCEMEYGTYWRANTFSIGGPPRRIEFAQASIGVHNEYFLHHRRRGRCTFRCRLSWSALNNKRWDVSWDRSL